MATPDYAGLEELMQQVRAITNPDPTPLLVEWRYIIVEDNQRGVLAGIDCFDQPMIPVTSRPKPPGPKKWTKRNENRHRSRRGVFADLGPYAAGFDDNLTPEQYRVLGGPPLAPRGIHSRSIKNLLTEHDWNPATGEGHAVGAWADVVSPKGVPFLIAHFTGMSTGGWYKGSLPVRDLRGIRQQGQNECFSTLNAWGYNVLEVTFT